MFSSCTPMGCLAHPWEGTHAAFETTDLYHAATLLHKVRWFWHV